MDYSRRHAFLALTSFVAISTAAAEKERLKSMMINFDALTVHPNGKNAFRRVFRGICHAGAALELHETSLATGAMPHAAHHHEHEEIILVREGLLEVTIAGKSAKLGPGSVAFFGSSDEHRIRNVGDTTAQYFVLAVGRQV